jgi:putative endonuclease
MGWLAQTKIDLLERTLSGVRNLAQHGRKTRLPAHLVTGIDGERAAYFYLRRKGYVVVAQRWSASELTGDLDLIAWNGPILCFVEVKTRTAHGLAAAEFAIDEHKRNILRRLARRYVRQLPGEAQPPVRFDVVSVYLVPGEPREIVHFENHFGWSEHRRDFD